MSSSPRSRDLTDLDILILTRLANGGNSKRVADDLGITPQNLFRYLSHIRDAMGATSTVHAVALAVRQGLIPGNPTYKSP